MKRLILAVVAALSAISAFAYEPEIRDIDIKVVLDTSGTAHITEVWDVVVASGTEWYLVRENLGDIRIANLSVTDESGAVYRNEGAWDVDRSISQKAGRCGLHRTSGGYEICWGVGSYGPHVFTVSYDMTNAVKSLNDYDALHMQFVSDELSAPPGHVRLLLRAPRPLGEDNSRIWGFGYEGTTGWTEDGGVRAESSEPFRRNSSLILLIRFDKGIFNSASVQERDFEAVLSRAMEGATFAVEEEELTFFEQLLALLFTGGLFWLMFVYPVRRFLMFIGVVKEKSRRRIKQIFGVRKLPKNPEWSRDLPFSGDILETYYVASHLNGVDDGKFNVIPAMMLHLMYEGLIVMNKDVNGKNEFHFNDSASQENLSRSEKELLDLLKKASGSDQILQEKEFRRWSDSNTTSVKNWVMALRDEVRDTLSMNSRLNLLRTNAYESLEFNAQGQKEAMKSLGFRQYLKEFTIINERYAPEVVLWGKYLMFASLFGMADKVAKDMNKLAPNAKIGLPDMPVSEMNDILIMTNAFRASASNAYTVATRPSGGSSGGSVGGFGGGSSFGGGGGFSGGGRGGGSR